MLYVVKFILTHLTFDYLPISLHSDEILAYVANEFLTMLSIEKCLFLYCFYGEIDDCKFK